MNRHASITVGGTFWPFHKGHKALLREAFSDGTDVFIGLTSEDMVKRSKPGEEIPSYGTRKRNLLEYVQSTGLADRAHVFRIEDEYGFAADFANLQAIGVTRFTVENAHKINKRRVARGMKPLDLAMVEIVNAEDGKPISSTRIRRGEIDEDGKLLRKGQAKTPLGR